MTDSPVPEPRHGPDTEPGVRLLSAGEVAAILGGTITGETVARSWRKWELPACRVGKFLRWHPDDVADYISRHRSAA